MTVFLTTHYMEEAAAADYVIVIDNGEIAAKGTPSELRERYASDRLYLVCSDMGAVRALLDEKRIPYMQSADRIAVNIAKTMDALPLIGESRPYISGFEVTAGTMDDAFIGITGKEMREI